MTTIGVAVSLPQPWADQIKQVRRDSGDPEADRTPTHITLLPPTVLDADEIEGVCEHLRKVAAACEPYRVQLTGTATFQPVSPVTYLPLVAGASETEILADAVCQGPLEVDLQFPFHPHVTVAHDVPQEALDEASETLADFDCEFEVTAFELCEASPSGWSTRETFELSARGREQR